LDIKISAVVALSAVIGFMIRYLLRKDFVAYPFAARFRMMRLG